MQVPIKRRDNTSILLIAGSIPVAVLLGSYFKLSETAIVIYVVIAALILGSMLLWSHANNRPTGEEWWQDDSCSGWRGY